MPWESLTTFEKEQLGIRSKQAKGWLEYEKVVEQYKDTAGLEDVNLQKDQLRGLAKQVDKAYPGFFRDWNFAEQPLAKRIRATTVVKKSKNKADWKWLLDQADAAIKAFDSSGKGRTQEAWRRWMKGSDEEQGLRDWIRENKPAFSRELERYEAGSSTFLVDLLD